MTPVDAPLLVNSHDDQATDPQINDEYLRHSPDSTTQLPYDAIKGAYSHGGRGYPHGCYGNDNVNNPDVDIQNGGHEPEVDIVTPYEACNGDITITINAHDNSGDIDQTMNANIPNETSPDRQDITVNEFSGSSKSTETTPQCNDLTNGNSVSGGKALHCTCNGLRLMGPDLLDNCACVENMAPKVNGLDQNGGGSPGGKNGMKHDVCQCKPNSKPRSIPTLLVQNQPVVYERLIGGSHDPMEIGSSFDDSPSIPSRDNKLEPPDLLMHHNHTHDQNTSHDPHNKGAESPHDQSPLLTRANLKSHDQLQDSLSRDSTTSRDHNLVTASHDQSADALRDDVSCSDSEPFMPQHPDSDSQASPLYPLLNGMFIQESQV